MSLSTGIWAIIGLGFGLFFGIAITYFLLAIKRDKLAEHPLPHILQPSPAEKEDLNNFLKEQFEVKIT